MVDAARACGICAGCRAGLCRDFLATAHHRRPGRMGNVRRLSGRAAEPAGFYLDFVCGVAASVWKLQRKELELTREELAQTKLAMEEQAKTAEQQRQEQRFFDLLNVYQRTVESIFFVVRTPLTRGEFQTQYTGKEAIAQFMRSNDAQHLQVFNKNGYGSWTSECRQVKRREDLIPLWDNEIIASFFDHYFRVIFRILTEAKDLLSNQEIPDLKDQHFRYIKLFRAQLSRSELMILGFNLWLDDEGKKMRPLAEKYGLLKHLPNGHLRTELEKLYPLAFGASLTTENAQPQ